MDTENPPITSLLRFVGILEVLALAAAGIGLFFVYSVAAPLWPWDIKPFNAGFVGATYLGSLMAVVTMLVVSRWTPARLVLPMLLSFTGVVLIVSLLNLDRFHFDRWATWAWFALYIIVPLDSLYHLWLYRRLPPAQTVETSSMWRAYLVAQGIILGLYALAMVIVPSTFTAFWPWAVDAFHAQMYAAIGFTAAAAAIALARFAAPLDFLTLGLVQTVLGLLAILDVVLKSPLVNYSVGGTWLWLGGFAIISITGVAMIFHSRSMKR